MNRRSIFSWVFVLVAVFMLSGCDDITGGDDNDDTATSTSSLRLANATRVNGLQLVATSSSSSSSSSTTTVSTTNVDSGTASSYVSLTSGTWSAIVSDPSGVLSASNTTSLSLSTDVKYTVVAYGRSGQIRLLALADSQSAASSGYASLTIANPGADNGALDVYLLAPGSSFTTDLTPTFSNVTTGGTSLANAVTAGSYDIVVTGYNKPSDLRARMSSVELSSTNVFTLILTGAAGGTLVDGALVAQGGAVVLFPAFNARVRVVAAFPAIGNSNSTVAVTVNGTALNSVTAPAVGTYAQVPANSNNYTVSVNGVAVSSLPAATFSNGGDYTLMVYGADPANPAVAVFTDNNQVPSSGAKIRLINGAAASLSLSANYVPLFSDLSYGSASEYSGVTAGSNLLRLTSPVTAFTTYSNTISLLSGGVYTLFVIGSTSDAIEVLVKDK